jgi:hypothetical protein
MSAVDVDQSVELASVEPTITFTSRVSTGLRFERDGIVFASNGRVGLLRQVIVDDRRGEIHSLVVEVDRTGERILIPHQGVERTRGSAVFLCTDKQQFETWLPTAPRFSPSAISRANVKSLLKAGKENIQNPGRVVQNAGTHFLETGRS